MKTAIIAILAAIILSGAILAFIYRNNLCKDNGCKSSEKADTAGAICNSCNKDSCDKDCTSNSALDTSKGKKIFASCSLSSSQSEERRKELEATIFKKIKAVSELKDGYEFTFNEPAEFSAQLLDFINFEKGCCSSFTFGLVFEPDGSYRLQLYGSPEIKHELKDGFKELELLK